MVERTPRRDDTESRSLEPSEVLVRVTEVFDKDPDADQTQTRMSFPPLLSFRCERKPSCARTMGMGGSAGTRVVIRGPIARQTG